MARFIDADELIKNLRDIKTLYGVPMISRDEQMLHWIIGHINEQPTAYDPEKVIEELKKDCFSPRDYYGYVVDIEKAIEIVEKGGIE